MRAERAVIVMLVVAIVASFLLVYVLAVGHDFYVHHPTLNALVILVDLTFAYFLAFRVANRYAPETSRGRQALRRNGLSTVTVNEPTDQIGGHPVFYRLVLGTVLVLAVVLVTVSLFETGLLRALAHLGIVFLLLLAIFVIPKMMRKPHVHR